jgi:biotin carboxylase
MAHVLMVGGHSDTVARIASLGVEITLFQLPAMVSSEQATLARRLVSFDYRRPEESLALARAFHEVCPFDAVVSFTEYGLENAARIAEALGVAGNPHAPVEVTRDKTKMRRLLRGGDVGTTRFRECHSREDALDFFRTIRRPMILKPSTGASSQGVATVDDESELVAGWDRSVAAGVRPIIAEEFIEGPEFSVESQSARGRHEIVAITEKVTTGKPGFVELGHQMPAPLPELDAERVRRGVLAFLDRIGHREGPVHTEIRLSADGPKIIEGNTRPGGDFIWELALLVRGVDFVKETVASLLGHPLPARQPVARAGAVRFFAETGGTVESVEGVESAANLPGVIRVSCAAKPGDILGPISSSDSRQGYVIAVGDSLAEAVERAERAHAAVRINLSPTRPAAT